MSARTGGRATTRPSADPRQVREASRAAADAAKARAAAEAETWETSGVRAASQLSGLLDTAREANARLRGAIERTTKVADTAFGAEPDTGEGANGIVGDGRLDQIRSVLLELHGNIGTIEHQITRLEAL